jgi:hypothetical protein
MSSSGYRFGVSADDEITVLPRSGKFIQVNPPTFMWQGQGQFDFQLASDIDFGNLLADVSVDGNIYALPSALEVTDTATFYWRVKPDGAAEYECLYAINLIAGSGNAGDANGDGLVNIGDAVFLINYVFKGGPAPDPLESGDANCDNSVDIGDAVYIVSYVFKGGEPPCIPE